MPIAQTVTPSAPSEEKTKAEVIQPDALIRLRYTGEKKGEMRTLIRATGKWIEFSALAPMLELERTEAVWLLRHRKDFIEA